LERALAAAPASPAVLAELAQLRGARDPPRARALFARALAADPRSPRALAGLGALLAGGPADERRQALGLLRRAVRPAAHPRRAPARAEREAAAAAAAARVQVAQSPDDADALAYLAALVRRSPRAPARPCVGAALLAHA
jgi:hypothetical protein